MPGDRAKTVANDGVRLHVREWPGREDDVLLIHGLASSSHIWDLVAPRLVRLGLHPVVYDQRGHGRSSKPSSGYGFDRITADAAAVIHATRLHRPIVVGHSWGANVALELTVRRSRLAGGTMLLHGGFVTLRTVRLDDRQADARTPRVRWDHGRGVPPARPPQPWADDAHRGPRVRRRRS